VTPVSSATNADSDRRIRFLESIVQIDLLASNDALKLGDPDTDRRHPVNLNLTGRTALITAASGGIGSGVGDHGQHDRAGADQYGADPDKVASDGAVAGRLHQAQHSCRLFWRAFFCEDVSELRMG
jgi:hypothetical protein